MAFSAEEGKGFFRDWLTHFCAPQGYKTFLDIGAGAGIYGRIIREVMGQMVTVDAVEIFEPYIKRHGLEEIYNRIFITDVVKMNKPYPYDLIIIGDTLEHLIRQDAIGVLRALKSYCRFIWCALPLKLDRSWSLGYRQGTEDFEENPHGKHLDEWTWDEIEDWFRPLWIVPYRITAMFLVEGEIR